MAAFLVGRKNDCIQALQRAYQAHLDRGEVLPAVRCGFWLAMTLISTGEPAVGRRVGRRAASGCSRTSTRTSSNAATCVQLVMFRHIFAGGVRAGAGALRPSSTDYGRRFGDPDLVANGLNAQGRMLLYSGRVPEGLALLDEAMVGISTGDVSPIFAGEIYCSLIEACQEVSDYGRAAEWTSALTSWIDAQPGLVPFTGQCAVHRGQIMRVQGCVRRSGRGVHAATERYAAADTPAPAGLAMAECGEVLRILGDLPAAEAAYERAVGFGYEAQPGRSLLWLDRGRTAAAVGAVNRLLAEPLDPVHRSQLLPGAVEVLLGAGEVEPGRRPSPTSSAGIAETFGCARLAGDGRLRAAAASCSPVDRPSWPCPSCAGRWPGGGRSTRRTRRRAHACSWAWP